MKKRIIAGCLAVLGVVCVLFAGRFLIIREDIQPADVILVLSGDRGGRIEKAAALYHDGYAPNMMISGGVVYKDTSIAGLMKVHAMELGVPKEDILLETKADSTYENALFSKRLLENFQFQSVIVVTSDYHTRRTKLIFERVFRNSGVRLYYVGASDPYFNEERWWSSNKSLMTTMTEYVKLIGYALGKNS